jgi:hypothetical protein
LRTVQQKIEALRLQLERARATARGVEPRPAGAGAGLAGEPVLISTEELGLARQRVSA